MDYPGVWVRIAGHVGRIRENRPEHWRAFVQRAGEEIPLMSWNLKGEASMDNVVHGSDPTGTNALKLNAWIDVFGDARIEDGHLTVTLHHPPEKS